MLDLLAALALASGTTAAPSNQLPADPWWERITVTLGGDGQSNACEYTSSSGEHSNDCTIGGADASSAAGSSHRQALTRITFERRFSPGAMPTATSDVQAGDTLLGREVMALAIDPRGSVKDCKVVATSGQMMVDYGCAEAQAERFQAGAARDSGAARQGYMTVLVYAHEEHVA